MTKKAATQSRSVIHRIFRRGIGKTVGRTIGVTADSLNRVANGLGLPTKLKKSRPGTKAGIEHQDLAKMPSSDEKIYVSCIDYCHDQVQVREITDLDAFLAQHRPQWSAVRWINVDALTNMKVVQSLAQKYHLHPLAVEDLLHIPQRPKADSYLDDGEFQARVFITCRMLQFINQELVSEQISMFLGHNTILTFQETHGDVWNPIRQRINAKGSRLRMNDASFLAYTLIDAIVDHCFPILEHYGERLEEIEGLVLDRPKPETIHQIHCLKRELLLLRRAVWPMRDLVHTLGREDHVCMSENTRTYLRDVYDHTVQIIDILETYREVASGLTETYMSSMSNRLNEVMKVLTIIGTIFIPLTFLAGVYGMNFHYMPEIDKQWAYPAFWGICVTLSGVMLIWFKRRGWL